MIERRHTPLVSTHSKGARKGALYFCSTETQSAYGRIAAISDGDAAGSAGHGGMSP